MFARFVSLLLLSVSGQVSVRADDPNPVNSCHPENGENACFDLENSCPWGLVDETARTEMPVCTQTPIPFPQMKRCHASQGPLACFHPDDPPCTTSEALKSDEDIASMPVCVDAAHLISRCSTRQPEADRCLHPRHDCFGDNRVQDDGTTELSLCSDIEVSYDNDKSRCDPDQPEELRCIDPAEMDLAETEPKFCKEEWREGLLYCNDKINSGDGEGEQNRCDPLMIKPCISPTDSCPYTLQNDAERRLLTVCEDLEAEHDLRCHDSNEASCRDPANEFLENDADCGLDVTTLKICEDLAHDLPRCKENRVFQCFDPNDECITEEDRKDADNADLELCPEFTFDAAISRCSPEQTNHRCIDPAELNLAETAPKFCREEWREGLKYCNDKISPGNDPETNQVRCDPFMVTPCIDPLQQCPYDLQNSEQRKELLVCEELRATHELRCHNSNEASCLDPQLTDDQQTEDLCGVDPTTLKLCEDLAHDLPRCKENRVFQCFDPNDECITEEDRKDADNADLELCPEFTFDPALSRCSPEQTNHRCIDPDEVDLEETAPKFCREEWREGLKYCNDKISPGNDPDNNQVRCDPFMVTPCIDPLQECPYVLQNYTERRSLLVCEELRATHELRCHDSNEASCLDPQLTDDQQTEALCGLDPTTLKLCEDLAHDMPRHTENRVARCLLPTEYAVGNQRADLNKCEDAVVDSSINRCEQLSYACIDPTDGNECPTGIDTTGMTYCNDLAAIAEKNRCDQYMKDPCLATENSDCNAGEDPLTCCTQELNPTYGVLKICEDEKTNFCRASPYQESPCIDPVPSGDSVCKASDVGELPSTLEVCADLEYGELDSNDGRCSGDADKLCLPLDLNNQDEGGTVVTGCDTICADLQLKAPTLPDNICTTSTQDALKCLKHNQVNGANSADLECATTDLCPGYENSCGSNVPAEERCLDIRPDRACFADDAASLSRCTPANIGADAPVPNPRAAYNVPITATKKRCDDEGQPNFSDGVSSACYDPDETECTTEENTDIATLKFCGDKAYRFPRSHFRQSAPCFERLTDNVLTGTQTPEIFQNYDLCEDIKNRYVIEGIPTCDVRQGDYACIDPKHPCEASSNPNHESLFYCADLVAKYLGTTDEVNRCDPRNRNPCVNPAVACPTEFLLLQPEIAVCEDLVVDGKRCASSNTNPCFYVESDGTEETCTEAEQPGFATLQVCDDAASRLNRCHSRQKTPCNDPTDPCTYALNDQFPTLGVCADLVSFHPSSLPSQIPSNVPSNLPSVVPSSTPSLSVAPSDKPSVSAAPSASPSDQPSASPSDSPSASPSESPSDQPSASPSDAPSAKPSTSASPSAKPSPAPSESPTGSPSSSPSASPTLSSVPSATPSFRPTVSMKPTFKGQTYEPSDTPSASPSASPSESPSSSPSASPSSSPSASPTSSPSSSPSASPTSSPSSSPSASPTGVTCVDDPDFLLDANENRNCEWVRENPDRVEIRCGKVDSVTNVAVADACPLSCNPECEDFVPTATPVTSEPTVSPETQCGEDDPTPFFVGNNAQEKNCEWVASRPNQTEKRCDKTATDGELVSTKCTFTCQLRCVCRNSKKKFRLNGERVKCRDVGRNQCDEGVRFRGRNTFVKERCPKKCNYCFDL